jgi:Holliday junction resolvase-like predicted endonuclease
MGAYCYFYIGSKEHSWKGLVPDLPLLLFEPADFVSNLHREDEEIGDWYEHKFISTCGKAKRLLEGLDINLQLLRTLHFDHFAFSSEQYLHDLTFRAERYLESQKNTKTTNEPKVEKFVRRLLRSFNYLTPDEEFAQALKFFECTGTRQDYIQSLEAALEQVSLQKKADKADPSDLLDGFYRDYLKRFLKKDPYKIYLEEEGRTSSGSDDLDLLYELGLSIFASVHSVPIEFDITEVIDAERQMSAESVKAFLLEGRSLLHRRAKNSVNAFGKVLTIEVSSRGYNNIEFASIDRVSVYTAKEKGDLLEELATDFFASQQGFKVKKNVKRAGEEIDLVIINKMADPFWASLQTPLIIVECKNQGRKVESKDVRNFEVKIVDRRGLCKLGIIISTSGFTKGCYEAASKCRRDGYNVVLIDRKLLQKRFDEDSSTAEWLEEIILEQC